MAKINLVFPFWLHRTILNHWWQWCHWCLFTCLWFMLCVSHFSLKASITYVIMGLETPPMAAMLLFKEQRWALQPIEQKKSRVAPPLWRCKTHNGAAAQCRGTSFPLFLCHPLQGVGEHEETAIPEEYREVMWESSALLIGQALAERLSVLVV